MFKKLYTCPCCGFKIFNEVFSEYEICEICRFQDSISSINNPFEEPYVSKNNSLFFLQQSILKIYPIEIRKINLNGSMYFRNPLWKPINISKFDKDYKYFPKYKFEEFKEKYPNNYKQFEKYYIEAQKHNPDDKVHIPYNN